MPKLGLVGVGLPQGIPSKNSANTFVTISQNWSLCECCTVYSLLQRVGVCCKWFEAMWNRRSQGTLGSRALPGRRKNWGPNLQGKVVSAPKTEQKSKFWGNFCWDGETWGRSGQFSSFRLCWEATTKKSSTFFRKKCTPIENPGYAYATWIGLIASSTQFICWTQHWKNKHWSSWSALAEVIVKQHSATAHLN